MAGRVKLHSLTIPEGWNFREALALIQGHAAVRTELKGIAGSDLMRRLGLDARHPECAGFCLRGRCAALVPGR